MGQTFFTIVIHGKMALLNAGRSRGGNCGPGKKCNLHLPPAPALASTSSTLAVVDDAGNSSSTCLSLSHWALIHQPQLKNLQLLYLFFFWHIGVLYCHIVDCLATLIAFLPQSILFAMKLHPTQRSANNWYSNIKHYSLTSDPTLWSLICARCLLI